MQFVICINMNKVFVVVFLGLFLSACMHQWTAIPKNTKQYENCKDFNTGAQMLKVPQFDKSYIIVHDCSAMDRERVSIAMRIFLQNWEYVFPYSVISNKKVKGSLNDLLAEFSDAKKTANAYTVTGEYGRDLPISGLTLSPGWVWVKAVPNQRLCDTSFIHELVHVAIWSMKGTDGDPDHLGQKHRGWNNKHMLIIQDTNAQLCELGI